MCEHFEQCTDNRFDLIEKYKKLIIEKTNIQSRPEEMQVLDSILFRLWQLGFLDAMEKQEQKKPEQDDVVDNIFYCPNCTGWLNKRNRKKLKHCNWCGQVLDWSVLDENKN